MTRFAALGLNVAACLYLAGCGGMHKEVKVENSTLQLGQTIVALRAAYAAFNRGDIDAAVSGLDEHIEWIEPRQFPGGGTYHGREGARQYLSQSRANLAEGMSEPEYFIVVGAHIVVFVHAHVRAKNEGEWQDINLADVYKVRDGRLVQMRAFASRDEALQWAKNGNP